MNPDTLTYLAQSRTDGKTAAEAAAYILADPRFARRIYSKPDLRGLFAGTLVGVKLNRAVANADLPDALRANVERVLMTVSWDDGYLDTIDPQHATDLRAGIAGLVAAGVLTEPEAQALLDLGGGYLLERLTAEEITAHWSALETAETLALLRGRCASGYNAVVAAVDAGETDHHALTTIFAGELGA